MSRFRIRTSVAIFMAAALVYLSGVLIAVLARQPAVDIPWMHGAYIGGASALLIGFPVRSALHLMRFTSLRAYGFAGGAACFASSATGVAFQGLGSSAGAVDPVNWIGTHPLATAVFMAAYAACGGLAGVLYWILARPDETEAFPLPG
jgi:hypothetical protein